MSKKKDYQPSSIVVIPARKGSTRFPNKPLAKILDKSLIQHVYNIADKSEADAIIIATDSKEIFNHVIGFGGNAVMTSESCVNGTERVLEAIGKLSDLGEDFDIIINVQGDEPLLQETDINRLIDAIINSEADVVTLIHKIEDLEDINNPNTVKVVCTLEDEYGTKDAMYFSRLPIPAIRTDEGKEVDYYKHLGVYAFTEESLSDISNMDATELEDAEKLEQLRWLQNHVVISTIETDTLGIGVDTPEDILIVENILKTKK